MEGWKRRPLFKDKAAYTLRGSSYGQASKNMLRNL